MLLVRPIMDKDLDGLYSLAEQTGPGLTSLPANKELLNLKIENSIKSFASKPSKPGKELYMFILEDSDSKQILGTSAIRAKVGGFEPFYSYEIKYAHHRSEKLNVDKKIPYLQLKAEHNGPSIIQSLFVAPDARKSGCGKLLSLARFMFIAEHTNRFEDTIIAEMRGVIDQNGYSPFWENVVRPFFDIEYQKADFLSSTDKGFIADLMPKHPIYIPLLAKNVVDVIGIVHKDTETAADFLYQQGFHKDKHVDIFDAGPRVSAQLGQISTIKNSATVKVSKILADDQFSIVDNKYLIANGEIKYRCTISGFVSTKDGVLNISESLAELLSLSVGSTVRYLKLT